MIDVMRRKHIRRCFLQTLKTAGDYALEESTLWQHVDDLVKPPTNFGERGIMLKFFKDGDYIRKAADTLDPEMIQWVITERGKNLLASL